MKIFIEGILPSIAKYSEKLDKLSVLLDEPWVQENEFNSFKKLIFRKDNSILVSENGNVSIGKWELLNKANSILIEVNSTAKLFNHCFLDEAVLILKVDGGRDYLTLVNQNIIPDLDVDKYFQNKILNQSAPYNIANGKRDTEIHIGNSILVIKHLTTENTPFKGDLVYINGIFAKTGKYKIDTLFYIHVVNGRIERTSML
ncbi:hypothetical protein L0657_19795 [Dyadobacter sp. CY345]|uniref:hypothetical protein n=1 Tax=Dyadobacter sp. CY345 TaxID=2909335 RepID=UPI001F3074DD|nr:hypothetical protein [Dyadobacter sp. CY345]MCF2446210.1 hypothetical protein [Dyadobacter sp. CY345]